MTMSSICYSPPIDGRLRKYLNSRPPRLINPFDRSSSIVKDLQAGTLVLCDRYAFSGIAFSASKLKPDSPEPPLAYEWCRAPDVSLPAPDLTLFLDILPEKAKERGGFGEERYEKEEVQERVRVIFDRIGEEVESAGAGRWLVLDGGLDQEEVEKSIWAEVKPLTKGTTAPIQKLWDKTREAAMLSALYI